MPSRIQDILLGLALNLVAQMIVVLPGSVRFTHSIARNDIQHKMQKVITIKSYHNFFWSFDVIFCLCSHNQHSSYKTSFQLYTWNILGSFSSKCLSIAHENRKDGYQKSGDRFYWLSVHVQGVLQLCSVGDYFCLSFTTLATIPGLYV